MTEIRWLCSNAETKSGSLKNSGELKMIKPVTSYDCRPEIVLKWYGVDKRREYEADRGFDKGRLNNRGERRQRKEGSTICRGNY